MPSLKTLWFFLAVQLEIVEFSFFNYEYRKKYQAESSSNFYARYQMQDVATALYESSRAAQYNNNFVNLGFPLHDACMATKIIDKEPFESSRVESLHDEFKASRIFDNEFLEFVSSSHEICVMSINFDNEFLEFVSLLHEICATSMKFDNEFLEFVSSLREICATSKKFDDEILEFLSSLHEICTTSINFDNDFMEIALSSRYSTCVTSIIFNYEFKKLVHLSHSTYMMFRNFALAWCVMCRENFNVVSHLYHMFMELDSSPNEICTTWNFFRKGIRLCLFDKNTPPHHRLFYHFIFLCSIFLSAFKCNVLRFLLHSIFMIKRVYVVYCRYWLILCSIYFFSSLCAHSISMRRKRREKMIQKIGGDKGKINTDECMQDIKKFESYFCAGGRHQTAIDGEIVCKFLKDCTEAALLNDSHYFRGKKFDFKGYKLLTAASKNLMESDVPLFYSKIPLDKLSVYLSMRELRDMSLLHNISIPQKIEKKNMLTYFYNHHCIQCDLHASVLAEKEVKMRVGSKVEKKNKKIDKRKDENNNETVSNFPPDAPSNALIESIIRGFCDDTAPHNLIEAGCAVCGMLSSVDCMVSLNETNYDLSVISPGDVGRYERLHESDPVIPLEGPILADNCDHICDKCQYFLKKKKMPPESLANSFWIGPIPLVLRHLTFAEKMLIARIRHNKCLVRVSSGRAKMTANVIMFSNPTVKVYHALPPSRHEISEVLAFIFQGPIQPAESDIKRTPMLVRRNAVKDALEWLKLNHVDYADLQISFDNLNEYPMAGVPVNIEYSKSDPESGNKIISAMSIYDNDFEDGTTDGPCPFTVHGLTGPEFENMSMDRLKARALQHLAEKGSTLGISHDSNPQSMYDNPQAYPQMFPWLFPYGFGGIGQKCHFSKVSESVHKKNLLMYHDKRFQTDFYFPMIAFNHEQLKAGVTGSFLLTKKKMWPTISNRLKSLNQDVLKQISEKLSNGGHFSPSTAEEKNCFQLLNDLDHVGGFVKGSVTSKKHMRNEIWSMISQLGAPSWFITLSPADNRHPICLYYADENFEFRPDLRSANERNLLIAQNPVAAARFFDLMVRMFIKHVLGVGTEHLGLYGNTAGYYGTVEQQGRLTLHLHTILWIKNALSPQEIRDKLMNNNSEFQQKLIEYLEGCQKGEFLTGPMEYVKTKIPIDIENRSKGIHTVSQHNLTQSINKTYQDPTLIIPEGPPKSCASDEHKNCNACQSLSHWWLKFNDTVDDILLRSNVHKCSSSDPEKSKFKAKGCLNKDGICKARFPRPIVTETTVNFEDGYINIKKLESMLNTISPCITYLFRCNTDVTSLLSGTSIKAVISYVSDYIAKPTLKTYQIFSTAYNVFDRNSKLNADGSSRTNDARKLILNIVNALSSKMEMGSPMASMYLLQNPDHYTSHEFIPFWWKSFVNDVSKSEISERCLDENCDIDIKIEGATEEAVILLSDVDEDNDDNYIDVEMEVVFEEKEGGKNLITNNDYGDDLKIHVHHSNPSKFDIEAPFSFDTPMDVDDVGFSVGGRAGDKQKLTSIHKGICQNGIGTDDHFEDQDEGGYGSYGYGDDKKIGVDDEVEEGDTTDEKVLILQDGDNYVVSSKVDDYKYRPEVYNFSSLYEWSKLSVKIKASLKNKDNTYFRFLIGHSQRDSHMVKLIPSRSETYVLNFIGGPLPRWDQGDFDYYCRTMLTLFKPWRNSRDLKDVHQSWAEAFTSYAFKIEDRKIMSNFNLRYECLDERDDYHAILKRQSKLKGKEASFLFQDQYDNECNLGISSNFIEDYGDQNLLGPIAIKKAEQMIEAEMMIKSAGFSDNVSEVNSHLNIKEFSPAIYKTGSQWKSLVKQHRENLLNIKKKNLSSPTKKLQNAEKKDMKALAVKVLPAEYFMHDFQAQEIEDRKIISNTIDTFSLNEEQKRAFRIVANHASEICPEQLKMHLGGMGGTGKTQVIKALLSMFELRQENHRFIVLAPTGTAAALLNGSTYHSILGICSSKNNGDEESLRNENSALREVQQRLEGVDYIFIDEISMIACHELFNISSQLSKVTNEHNKPFGGKNIILAGDFAQLPPTNGSPLYSNNVSNAPKNSMSRRDQESTIGKLLWHQITTVVILTQNMRQTEMTDDDKKFRTALSNMRYAACTEDDLEFLESLHVDHNKKGKSLADPMFKNVSIITSLNTQKDQINEICSLRFARETGQHLTHFYSIDKLGNADLERKKRGSRASKKISASADIPDEIQNTLWDSSPNSSEHFPGKLSLCLGMPVMIRNNDATELCITKGQEAYVVGWDAIDGPKGKKILETLFLELKNPPKEICLPHLPKNVIPMSKASKKIKCNLPNDHELKIIRQQINVLPNFSITDYASQGKTRPKNPVNLSHCRNFQSIYTCLSRSSSAAGTLIIKGFNSNKVTKGLPGHLRQEFRELHLLDIITKEIYEGRLDKKYFGPLRNAMIYKYRKEIQKNNLNGLHKALTSSDEEYVIREQGEDSSWNINSCQNLTDVNSNENNLKRKVLDLDAIDGGTHFENTLKKIKLSSSSSRTLDKRSPLGLIWDEKDYSCAYDSFFTVLYHIWNEGQLKHRLYFENGNQWIQILHSNFTSLFKKTCTFELVRDRLRSTLNNERPLQYRYGRIYTDIDELIRDFTSTKSYGKSYLHCPNCKMTIRNQLSYLSDYTVVGWSSSDMAVLNNVASIQSYLDYKIVKRDKKTHKMCPRCRNFRKKDFPLYCTQYVEDLPAILMFALAPWIDINQCLQFDVSNVKKYYILKGIIYSNDHHFTARLVDKNLTVWYHDGQTTRALCREETSLQEMDDIIPLKIDGEYRAILVFYVEK